MQDRHTYRATPRPTTSRPSTRSAAFLAMAIVSAAACSSSGATPGTDMPPSPPAAAEAPWQSSRLSAASVPEPYFTAWSRADNRNTCALIAPAATAATQGATPRVATFSGGWGVAYDQAGVRSAFGIAGTGASASEPAYHEWPHRLTWADGSSVGYGPEGGSGPNQLAYLTIAGQQCLYNVWSRLGVDHLEQLLGSLRFVDTGGGL